MNTKIDPYFLSELKRKAEAKSKKYRIFFIYFISKKIIVYETVITLKMRLNKLDYKHTGFKFSLYFLTLVYPHVLWLLKNSNHIANAVLCEILHSLGA